MSQNRSRRSRGSNRNQGAPGTASSGSTQSGNKQSGNKQSGNAQSGNRGGGNRSRSGRKRGGRKPALDAKRPFWENPAGEAEVHGVIDLVRPAQDPAALVRSLGSPPLGKYADNAQHYYTAVYEKAQHFAVAMATANGVLVVAGDDGDATGGEGDPPDPADGRRA